MFFFGEKGEKENTLAKRIQSKILLLPIPKFLFFVEIKTEKKANFYG